MTPAGAEAERTDMTQSETPPRARGRARRRLRRTLRGLAWAVLIASVVLGGLAWRLTQGSVALPAWTVARIEARIGRDLAPRALSLGRVSLTYDLEARALRLRLRGARLVEGGTALVTVPDARVALDAAALLRGKLRPRAVRVEGLALEVARDASGRFSLAFGAGGGALPGSWPEALETLDAALATPVVAGLTDVEVTGVALRFADAATGLSETAQDGTVTWRRDASGARLAVAFGLDLGGRRARVSADLSRAAGSEGQGVGAQAGVALEGLSLEGLAEALPGIPALALLRGEIAAEGTIALSESGVPGPLRGRLDARNVRMTDRPAMRLDRAILGFDWQFGSGRIALSEISASSDELSTSASGQILLEDGLVGPVQAQISLGPTILDPEGLFDRRVAFDAGLLELRLTQAPLALRVGQAMLTGPSGTARLSGRIGFEPGGAVGALRLAVPRMAVSQMLALWPPSLQPQAREWLRQNLRAGVARGATALLRLEAGAPPRVEATFDFSDATFRYIRDMPPARGASGAAQLSGDRFALRVDAGTVPATGPVAPDADGRIDVSGTTFAIPDTRARPAEGIVELRARGAIGDMLTLLDNRPFRLLTRLGRGPDLASGRAEAQVTARLPLRPGNAPADIDFAVDATLRDFESRTLVPGRVLAGEAVALNASPTLVAITGDVTLQGVPFAGRWEQALPAPSTVRTDPDAPDGPPVPLPSPGRVTGTARLDPEGLARLGVTVPALDLSGETEARVTVTLPQGGAPRIAVETDLRGVTAALPAIGWSKPRDRAATLAVEATLGSVPAITRVAVDAQGLKAEGRVTFRPGGGLAEARFARVDTGWFRGPVVLTGRGSGVSPAIRVPRGTADLRRALLAVTGDGGGDGDAPLDIALDRLTVTEGIALTDLRALLRGGAGGFTGRINGGAAVQGRVGPDIEREGTAVQATGADAGAVLRSAGLFQDAVGGTIAFTLRPTPREGVYDGAVRMGEVRVRNAPALASLLQALSVVGILEQLAGEGLYFPSVESDFILRPNDILVRRASAVGPSMSITADGTYDIGSKRIDLEGVISPIYLVNGLFGALFARRDEGLFGFTYRLFGPAADPQVSVNPLSILTPGVFREIFRRAPPS